MAEAVTYDYYTDEYLGNAVSEDDWPGYEARARAHLAKFKAQFKLVPYDGDADAATSCAICAMAEQLQNVDLVANGLAGASSVSIGSVSASLGNAYSACADLSEGGQERSLLKCAQLYFNVFAGLR